MHVLKDVCSNLEYQLEDIVKKGDITMSELDSVYKAVKTLYYIKTIEAMENYGDDGYSRDGSSYGRYSRGMDYGYSNRGRDSMGRYSRDGEREHNGVMKELGDMMSRAGSDIERQTIAKLMDRLQ